MKSPYAEIKDIMDELIATYRTTIYILEQENAKFKGLVNHHEATIQNLSNELSKAKKSNEELHAAISFNLGHGNYGPDEYEPEENR